MRQDGGASRSRFNLLAREIIYSHQQTDTQGRGCREGLVESRDLIWAHSPNPGLPSLSLFPWLHGGIMEKWFRVEWRIQKKQWSSAENKVDHTDRTQEIEWAVLRSQTALELIGRCYGRSYSVPFLVTCTRVPLRVESKRGTWQMGASWYYIMATWGMCLQKSIC